MYVCYVCYMYSKRFERNPPEALSEHSRGFSAKRQASLEADCTLSEVFGRREANTGNPSLGLGIEALKEAEDMLLLNQLVRGHALELLAKIIAANFSLCIIEEEKHMLLLILHGVELAGTLGIGLISEGDTLSQVADCTIVTCDFCHVVSVLEAAKCFTYHKHFKRSCINHLQGSYYQSSNAEHLP